MASVIVPTRKEMPLSGSSDRLMKLIIARLAEVLAAEGFIRCPPLDSMGEVHSRVRNPRWRRAWFTASPDTAGKDASGVSATIRADLLLGDGGGVGVEGRALLMSSSVADVRASMPMEALVTSAEHRMPGCLESVPFGHFQNPHYIAVAKIWIALDSEVGYCADRFMESVNGPVRQWFERRENLTDLLALAPTPHWSSPDEDNPDPVRLRGVVILACLEGRVQDAVSLMDWYWCRDRFDAQESPERLAAFDAEMVQRFPEYSAARHG